MKIKKNEKRKKFKTLYKLLLFTFRFQSKEKRFYYSLKESFKEHLNSVCTQTYIYSAELKEDKLNYRYFQINILFPYILFETEHLFKFPQSKI